MKALVSFDKSWALVKWEKGTWAFHSCSGWVGPRALPNSIVQRSSRKQFGQVDQKKRKHTVVVLDVSGELGVVCNYFNIVFYCNLQQCILIYRFAGYCTFITDRQALFTAMNHKSTTEHI